MDLLHKTLRVVDCGVERLIGGFPPSVKIAAGQTAPVVPINHSIGVQHGNDLEDEVLPQHPGFLVIGIGEECEDSAHHPGADSFTGMDPSGYYHALALGEIFQVVCRGNR